MSINDMVNKFKKYINDEKMIEEIKDVIVKEELWKKNIYNVAVSAGIDFPVKPPKNGWEYYLKLRMNEYNLSVKKRMSNAELLEIHFKKEEITRKAAIEWIGMSQNDRDLYNNLVKLENERYNKTIKEIISKNTIAIILDE